MSGTSQANLYLPIWILWVWMHLTPRRTTSRTLHRLWIRHTDMGVGSMETVITEGEAIEMITSRIDMTMKCALHPHLQEAEMRKMYCVTLEAQLLLPKVTEAMVAG